MLSIYYSCIYIIMSVSAMANVNNSLVLYYIRGNNNNFTIQFTNPCTITNYRRLRISLQYVLYKILNSNSIDSRVIVGLLVGKQQRVGKSMDR